jgi:hypothetical protein
VGPNNVTRGDEIRFGKISYLTLIGRAAHGLMWVDFGGMGPR